MLLVVPVVHVAGIRGAAAVTTLSQALVLLYVWRAERRGPAVAAADDHTIDFLCSAGDLVPHLFRFVAQAWRERDPADLKLSNGVIRRATAPVATPRIQEQERTHFIWAMVHCYFLEGQIAVS